MADRAYRVSFIAKPIIVHARDSEQAINVAIEYARQDGTRRIVVESAEPGDKGEQ